MKKIFILAIFLVFGFCSKSFGQAFGSVTADVFKVNQSINMTSTEAGDAVIYMYSDEADDNADKWSIVNPATTNTLSFKNNGSAELTISSGGNLVATGSITGTAISGTTGAFITTLSTTGVEGGDATLNLWADEGDDAADKWSVVSPASDNTLTIKNSTSAELTLTSGGNLTATGSITGTAISGTTGAFVTTLKASGAEGGDVTLNLWSDEGDDTADKFNVVSTATDTLVIKNDTTALLTFDSAGVATFANTISGTEINMTGVAGSGKAICVKADGNWGVCSDAVGGGGTCTCG